VFLEASDAERHGAMVNTLPLISGGFRFKGRLEKGCPHDFSWCSLILAGKILETILKYTGALPSSPLQFFNHTIIRCYIDEILKASLNKPQRIKRLMSVFCKILLNSGSSGCSAFIGTPDLLNRKYWM
jgi:hypothetical protein